MALPDFPKIVLCLVVGLPVMLAGCVATVSDMSTSLSMAPAASDPIPADGVVSLAETVSVLPVASAAYVGEADVAVATPVELAALAEDATVSATAPVQPVVSPFPAAPSQSAALTAPAKPMEDESEFTVASLAEDATAPVRSLARSALSLTGLDDAGEPRGDLDRLIVKYAEFYEVPVSLVRRVVKRESNFRPSAYNRGHWGLMQIKHATARGMGYRGPARGLLDAETNLKYAVKYLRGAYMVADGNPDRADRLYQSGYYYDAKRKGLLDETGLGKDRRRRKS